MNISSKAANTDIAKDFIDPVADYLETRKKAKDEVTQLERKESILKLKKSIRDLKKDLNNEDEDED
uniref:Uncharacterized protein n=2 Tax=unclassified Candidatus Kentrum TaxID=2643149 RepID=A0A451AGJ2_9GAMM|nr:MAG: hypothetical protein BECKLPF1236A_GA0070988_1000216 [Candidatus Kentron sp. LPFa]VFK23572.1 MAG: hypothetical protein BECKLPF1236C_GA0070990_1000627 [Candidatus Kentron sp. LPFa]VFK65114.1 MAG: hypothetical protein BECKUNK1418G_GA0071005_105710 [Candidatus Kentron sp. UNK]VFK71297.1 MAG: hypothetical protein BECKUNK1418H_GA0071006_105910 [Candidatus Kentron sp. UNK]